MDKTKIFQDKFAFVYVLENFQGVVKMLIYCMVMI